MFKIIPAIDLKDRRVVRLRQGKENEITFEAEKPIEIAKNWIKKGAKALHVIDLDGAFRGRLKHEDIIYEILKLPVEVQVGGGIRDFKIAERLLCIGAKRVIFGTLAVLKVSDVREFAEKWSGRVMIAIDSKAGRITIKGWKEKLNLKPVDLAKLYDDLEVSFLYTNVDVEGLGMGIDIKKIEEVVHEIENPVYVAGGISSIDDVKAIKEMLVLMTVWFRDAMVCESLKNEADFQDRLINVDRLEILKKFTGSFESIDFQKIMEKIEYSIELIDRNVFLNVILFQLVFELKMLLRRKANV